MLMLFNSAQKASSTRRLHTPSPTKYHAFSLIEILVVISVIALIVAILLPVLGKSREAARMLICANQLRSLGEANQAFALDHNGLFSAVANGPADDNNSNITVWEGDRYRHFGNLFADYLYGAVSVYFCPSSDPVVFGNDPANMGVASQTARSTYFQRGIYQGAPRSINGRVQDPTINPMTINPATGDLYYFVPIKDTKPRRALVTDLIDYLSYPPNHWPGIYEMNLFQRRYAGQRTVNVLYNDLAVQKLVVPKYYLDAPSTASSYKWKMARTGTTVPPGLAGELKGEDIQSSWSDLDRECKN